MIFDHTEAYDDFTGEIGKRLKEIFEIADKHQCPMLFVGVVRDDGKHGDMLIKSQTRYEEAPKHMLLAHKILTLQQSEVDLLSILVDYMIVAINSIDQASASTNNAIIRPNNAH